MGKNDGLRAHRLHPRRGLLDEAQDKFQEAANFFKTKGGPGRLSEAYHLMGMVALSRKNYEESERLHTEALRIGESPGDPLSRDPLGIAFSKHELGRLARERGRFLEGRELLQESYFGWLRLGEKNDRIAPTLHELGMLSLDEGDWRRHHDDNKGADDCYKEARNLLGKSLEMKRSLGMLWAEANSLHELGRVARVQKELERAHQLFDESLELKRRLEDEAGTAHTLLALGRLLVDEGKTSEARDLSDKSMEIYTRFGNAGGIAACTYTFGLIAKEEGDKLEAKRLFSEAETAWESLGSYRAFYARRRLDALESDAP